MPQARTSPRWLLARIRRGLTRARHAGALLLVGALVSGCASDTGIARDYVRAGSARADLEVAVIPFENLTNYPNAGQIVAELMVTELYKQGTFKLVEGTALRARLRAARIDPAGLASAEAAARLAARLGADAVLIGSVSEYGYQHGLHEEPTVGINLRLVAAGEDEVLWAASHSGTGRGYLRRDSVNEAAQRVVMHMVDALNRELTAR